MRDDVDMLGLCLGGVVYFIADSVVGISLYGCLVPVLNVCWCCCND